MNLELSSDYGTPASYKEAMNGEESKSWAPSMEAEIKNFVKRKSWQSIKRSEAQKSGQTIMG